VRGSSRTIERYNVYLADLDPTRGGEIAKTRPVVVVSLDAMNRHLDTVVVCPLTTRLHPRWRSRIQCVCAGRKAEIAVDQIRTITKERLGRRLDRLEPSTAAQVRQIITEMYGA
jgi:mRNA interferase MazF